MRIKQIIVGSNRKSVHCSVKFAPTLTTDIRMNNAEHMYNMRNNKLYREYEMLKTLHKMGLPIKFEDFSDVTYRFTPNGNKLMIVAQENRGIHKMLKVEQMVKEFGVGPATIAEFFDVNGAIEVNSQGKPVPAPQKAFRGGVVNKRPVNSKKKLVYRQGEGGFWKQVEVDIDEKD